MAKTARQEGTITKALEHVPIAGHLMAGWHYLSNSDDTVALQAFNRANNGTAAALCTGAAIACAPATATVGTMLALGAAGGAVGSVAGNEVQAVSEIIEKDLCGKDVEMEGVAKFKGGPKQILTEAAIGGVTGLVAGGCATCSAGSTAGLPGATMGKDSTVTVAKGMATRLPGQTATQAQINAATSAARQAALPVANNGVKQLAGEAAKGGLSSAATLATHGKCTHCHQPATLTCTRCAEPYCLDCGKKCRC